MMDLTLGAQPTEHFHLQDGAPLYSYDVNQVNILSPSGGLVALNVASPSGGVALMAANWKVVATPCFLA